jgi:hypothetical protein
MVGAGWLDDDFGDNDGEVLDWISEGVAKVTLLVAVIEVVFLATAAWRLAVSAPQQQNRANTRLRETRKLRWCLILGDRYGSSELILIL